MDFFQFLSKSSSNSSEQLETEGIFTLKTQLQKQPQPQSQLETTLYKNLKVGDFVKIIYSQNSNLNTYKGYIGEVKEYKKDQSHALIFLHGITSHTILKFPLYHFIKFNNDNDQTEFKN
jgi:hypothetical protein